MGGGQPATGCSDRTREGFVDEARYPRIAACAGGFQVPGVLSTTPTCARAAGNDGARPQGSGCSAADLCAFGFHVCASEAEVAALAPAGCADATPEPNQFFATGQSSTGCGICALGTSTDPTVCTGCSCATDCAQTSITANDVFGCGDVGAATTACGVLNAFSNDVCMALPGPWTCGADGCDEANNVSKSGPDAGGVLCCAD